MQNILDALKKELKKIEVIYPNDIDDFNIYDNEFRKKYKINKPITTVKPYLDTLLNISTKRINLYQDIINFNQDEFIRIKETYQNKFFFIKCSFKFFTSFANYRTDYQKYYIPTQFWY